MCTGFFVSQPKRCFFCLKWGRMMEEAEKILIQKDGVIAPTFFQTRSWVAKSDVRGIIRNGCGLRVDYKYAYIVEE